uniref:Uncharacterized protein n=1 Tax=Alexandrium monilatum TaxID=311494 RepID=A0A7S4UJ76_9DINO
MVGAKLVYGEPPPLFFGTYPLTVGVQVICVFHALLCIFVIAAASSVVTLHVYVYEVSPTVQALISAWHMLGVSVTVGALISCSLRNEFPMRVYCYYLLVTVAGWAVLTVSVISQGRACSFVSDSKSTERIGSTFSCGMISAMGLFAMLTISVLVAYCSWLVWHMKEHLAERENAQSLLHLEDPQVKALREGRDIGLGGQHRNPYEDFDEQSYANNFEEKADMPPVVDRSAWANPRPGQQPDWGSLRIRMART